LLPYSRVVFWLFFEFSFNPFPLPAHFSPPTRIGTFIIRVSELSSTGSAFSFWAVKDLTGVLYLGLPPHQQPHLQHPAWVCLGGYTSGNVNVFLTYRSITMSEAYLYVKSSSKLFLSVNVLGISNLQLSASFISITIVHSQSGTMETSCFCSEFCQQLFIVKFSECFR
jgi:hypothetical protein